MGGPEHRDGQHVYYHSRLDQHIVSFSLVFYILLYYTILFSIVILTSLRTGLLGLLLEVLGPLADGLVGFSIS